MGVRSAGCEVRPSFPAKSGGPEPAGRVLLASPHGWCAGVDRAVKAVETALERYGPPVYVRRQIVHNHDVVASLRDRGAVFVDEVSQVPEGAITVFSAHGVAPAVREEAARRDLRTIDATCPLVTKVHHEARRLAAGDYDIVLIGQPGHDEVVGTTGQAPARTHLVSGPGDVPHLRVRDPARVAWLSQTTLSVDETAAVVDKLRERFPALLDPPSDDICYAAQNRQFAVRVIAADCDLMLVAGSANSHNSGRLVQVALAAGARVISGGTFLGPVIQGRDVQITWPPAPDDGMAPGLSGDGPRRISEPGAEIDGHAFISYIREDAPAVDLLQERLQVAGIPVWLDTAELWPGEDWRLRIRDAITNGALVFIACFSARSLARTRSYQNEELALALEQLRLRPPKQPWLIPVRLDDCEIPDRDIGGGRTLASIQRVDLFGDHFEEAQARLVEAILRILE